MWKKQIPSLLEQKHLTLCCAESCTGGLVSHLITNTAGSSKYFKGAIVCYSVESKQNLLKISSKILNEKGVVSEEIALRLAKNVKKLFKTDIGISITGIAGPTTDNKNTPVGTVFIGINIKQKTFVYKFMFKGARQKIKKEIAEKTLELLSDILSKI